MNNYCNHCGAQVANNQPFCPYCGNALTPTYQQPQYAPPQGSDNKNTILIVIVAVLATLLIAGVAIYFFTRDTGTKTENVQPANRLEQLQQTVCSSYLSDSDIASLNANDRRLLRNYIYAKHGYIFNDSQLSSYFRKFDWYQPLYTSQSTVENMFNDVETSNAKRLTEEPKAPRTKAYSAPRRIGEGYHTFIGHCNIREYPTSNSYIVGTAENGERCYVTSDHDGSWYWVILDYGVQGWTHKQNLR